MIRKEGKFRQNTTACRSVIYNCDFTRKIEEILIYNFKEFLLGKHDSPENPSLH